MRRDQWWQAYAATLLLLCAAAVAVGAWLIRASLRLVRAPEHRVSLAADGGPHIVTWRAHDAAWHSAAHPDCNRLRVQIGSPYVWYDPETPHVLGTLSEDRPVSTFGIMLVSLGLPVAVGCLAAMARTAA